MMDYDVYFAAIVIVVDTITEADLVELHTEM